MEKLVIFGNGQVAELAYARFRRDARYEIVGFTVDRSHLREPLLLGLRVVAFEDIEREFPAESVLMFIAVGPVQTNRIRTDRFLQARRLGYRFVSYVSSRAIVDPGVQLGENCSIGEGAIVQPYVRIGENVRIGSASVISHHCVVEDHCFLASNCVLSGSVRIGARAFLGAGATIRDRVNIGEASIIGAGATIVRDTTPESVHVAPDAIQLPTSSGRIGL